MYATKLGHVHLKVRDLERAIAFYTTFFSLRVVEQVGDQYAFLTGGPLHHEVALQRVGPQATGPRPHSVGLYHVAFEVASREDLAAAYDALSQAGIEAAPVDHGISWALYFNDPDGNGLELYCDTRGDADGTALWRGHNRSLRLTT